MILIYQNSYAQHNAIHSLSWQYTFANSTMVCMGRRRGCLKHLTDNGYEPLRGTMPIELFSKLPDHSGFDPMAADTPSMLLTSVNITS